MVPALQMAFKLGLRYLPLARVGLDALEHWLEVLPQGAIKPYLPQILPSFNDYMSKEWLAQKDSAILEDLATAPGRSRKKKNKSELIEMVLRKREYDKVIHLFIHAISFHFVLFCHLINQSISIVWLKEPVSEIQVRIIRLLGRLGGDNVHLIGAVNLAAQGTESRKIEYIFLCILWPSERTAMPRCSNLMRHGTP